MLAIVMRSLQQLVADELAVPALPQVQDFAAHIAAQYPDAARAVLFYGSCLRSEQLEGQMLDFYLIVSDYDAAYDTQMAGQMEPPPAAQCLPVPA